MSGSARQGLPEAVPDLVDIARYPHTNVRFFPIDIQGYILFTNDTDYWQANSFRQIFQNVTTFFQLGGEVCICSPYKP